MRERERVCVNVKSERPDESRDSADFGGREKEREEKSERERRARDLTKDGTAPTSEEITGSAIAIASRSTHPTLSPFVG